jgi:hypothetical protein
MNSIPIQKYYQEFRPILEEYRKILMTEPRKMQNPIQIVPDIKLLFIEKFLEEQININDAGQNNDLLYLDKFTLKLLELYFFGIETKFDQCSTCSFFSITYPSFKICACDKDFQVDLTAYKTFHFEEEKRQNRRKLREKQKLQESIKRKHEAQLKEEQDQKKRALEQQKAINDEENKRKAEQEKQNYLANHPPFSIWDKAEDMLKNFLRKKNAYIYEIRVFYDSRGHKDMWDIKAGLTDVILSKQEISSNSKKKRLTHDGKNSCFYCLADVLSKTDDMLELRTEKSFFILYELIIGH